MSFFIPEAFTVGLKEGVKVLSATLLILCFIKDKLPPIGRKLHLLGLILSILLSIVLSIYGSIYKAESTKFIGYSFGLLYIGSVMALYQSYGLNLMGPLRRLKDYRLFIGLLLLFAPLFLFTAEIMGSLIFLHDLSIIKEKSFATYGSALGGILASVFLYLLAYRYVDKLHIGSFLGLPQLLLSLGIIKLLGGGVKGFAELSLIPSVQKGLVKLFHDMTHQLLIFFMVPDHPLLTISAWNFIGILFGRNITTVAALSILLLPPLIFLYKAFFDPLPEFPDARSGAEKRRLKAEVRTDRRRKAFPVIIFIFVILWGWYSTAGERAATLYNPKPTPVTEDKGIINIPLKDPTTDLLDGRLHKFSFSSGEDIIKFIVIKRLTGTLAVCLDACEICPPEGYGQREEHVICIYCMTPIPVNTVGEPGGCNPIPLEASVTERDVRIEVVEIQKKWQDVKTGKTKESLTR